MRNWAQLNEEKLRRAGRGLHGLRPERFARVDPTYDWEKSTNPDEAQVPGRIVDTETGLAVATWRRDKDGYTVWTSWTIDWIPQPSDKALWEPDRTLSALNADAQALPRYATGPQEDGFAIRDLEDPDFRMKVPAGEAPGLTARRLYAGFYPRWKR